MMTSYSPELVETMRAALDEAITRIPIEQATPEIKVSMAVVILQAAAAGRTDFQELLSIACEQTPASVSRLI